jgi:hypothetical protein
MLQKTGRYEINGGLLTKGIRIHPVAWNGCPHIKIRCKYI